MESFDELSNLSARKRAAFGLRAGARLGAYFAVLTAVVAALIGRGEREALPAIPLALGVLSGFLMSGVIFGLFRPSVRHTAGAALLGAACLAPILFATGVAVRSRAALSWSTVGAVVGFACILGGMLGTMAWRGWTRSARS